MGFTVYIYEVSNKSSPSMLWAFNRLRLLQLHALWPSWVRSRPNLGKNRDLLHFAMSHLGGDGAKSYHGASGAVPRHLCE